MTNVLVSITPSDLNAIKQITGQTKNATAIKDALSQWLIGQGLQPNMSADQGGYRSESKSYWGGYQHSKTIISQAHLNALDSQFDAWCSANSIDPTADNYSSWEKGVRDGWFKHFSDISKSTAGVTIYHLEKFFEVCQTNGIHDIEKADISTLQEIFLLSHPQYGE